MTLQELRFIIALAREKHFGKAASATFVSQPTLSIAIQKLEQELGVILFKRDRNIIRVTEIGEEIVARARRVMHEVDEMKSIASSINDFSLPFKLGAIYTIGPYFFPPFITAFQQLKTGMPIEIIEDYTVNLRKKLINGELDAVLISLPFTAPDMMTQTLYKESFVVLMPAKHPLAKYKTIQENMLLDYPLLMLGEGHCFRDQVIAFCPVCFKNNSKIVENASLETIRHMVAGDMGVTILPESAAQPRVYSKLLTTRPLKAHMPHRTVALAYRQNFRRMKAIEKVLQIAKNIF